jgi:polysaccharide export outer membrane protein
MRSQIKENCKKPVVKLLTILLFTVFFNLSCVPFNRVRYFTDIDEIQDPTVNPIESKKIMPSDNLFIRVLSTDEQASRIFNLSDDASSGMGYTVDEKGNIDFPFVGKINVAGLTTEQCIVKIHDSLNQYISNSSVIVRFVDNRISILGEVQRQGSYTFNKEKLNIYEALSLGGGLTLYGDRSNVILIRQEGNKILHYRINLSDSKVANKDYYYILSNDVIVVEPMRAVTRIYSNIDFQVIVTTITTIVTLYILLLNRSN